jgi:hypothetical protein
LQTVDARAALDAGWLREEDDDLEEAMTITFHGSGGVVGYHGDGGAG